MLLLALGAGGGMHGLYADDYVYKYFGSALPKTEWTPNTENINYRVLAIWLAPLLARWLPEAELPIRFGLIALHGLDVVLLGWLALRLTGSRWLGVIAGGGFIVPLFAYEAVLWFSAGIFYLLPLTLLLIGFHLILSCTSPGKFYFGLGALAAWVLMIFFVESGLLLPLLTPWMAWMMGRRGAKLEWRVWLAVLGVTYVVLGGYVLFVLRSSPIVAVHGKTTLDPMLILTQRVPEVLASVWGYAVDWLPRGMYADAFLLGAQVWMADVWFWILMIGLMVAFVFALREMTTRWHEAHCVNALGLVGLGVAWFVLALSPVLFIRGLAVSSRVMLFPSAGLALAAAGVAGRLMEKSGARKNLIAMAAMVLLLGFMVGNALSMAGLLRVYQLRWARDQQQFAALRAALPELPRERVWLLAHALDQTIVQKEMGRATVLDHMLYALFDTPWAIDRALWLAYASEKIVTVDKDSFGQSHVVGLETDAQGKPKTLVFQGTIQIQKVPVPQLLAFTYRANGFEWLTPLVLNQGDNGYRVPLPLIEAIKDAPKREAQIGIEKMQ